MSNVRYGPYDGGAALCCLDCGSVVLDQAAHTRFHSILAGHAWALAVLRTSHIAAHIHDRYDVIERMDRKKFDSWSAEAFAEVVVGLDEPT